MVVGNTSQWWPFPRRKRVAGAGPVSRELLANLREVRRSRRRGGCAVGCGHQRTSDARLPWSTDELYGGWGGYDFHGTEPGADRPPVVFVHGNQRDACDWLDHAEFFLERGYGGDELWAVTFGEGSASHPEMAAQLDAFVRRVRAEADAETVSLVAHSLGVTGVRFWLAAVERYDWVDTVVGLAGANHGTVLNSWCALTGLTRGTYKASPFLRADYAGRGGHPLAVLNEDETPGDVDYYTLRGTEDPLFWGCPGSPALAGATNVALETDHDGVRTDVEALEYIFEWVSEIHPYDLTQQVALPRDHAGTGRVSSG